MNKQKSWQAGVAKVCITPSQSIWLAGFALRDRPSEGVLQDIFVKVLALKDESGIVSILLTADLLTLPREFCQRLASRAHERFGVKREHFLFNASHNHSGPVIKEVLAAFYDMSAEQSATVNRYTDWMEEQFWEAIELAVKNFEPVTLAFEQGLAGFGVNRRRSRPGGRHLPGPTDPDVPVLSVRDDNGNLRAVVFGYACHTTALGGYEISGDYAGFAQAELEKVFPGAIAMFLAGCGGDINPLPRFQTNLAQMYGKILASAVCGVLHLPMQPVEGTLRAAFTEATLPLQTAPSRDQLQQRFENESVAPPRD